MKNLSVCSWSYQKSTAGVAAEMKKNGIDHVQLALCPFIDPKAVVPGGAGDSEKIGGTGGAEPIDAQRRQVEKLLSDGEWKLSATMFNSAYEDYSSLDAIKATGGIVPDEHWEENRELIRKAVALTKEWAAPLFMLHAGFLDESDKAALAKFTDRVKFIRDLCGESGVDLILETGQERAADLAEFLSANEGVYVNLDPANIILYNKGNPVEAVKILAPWIRHVHVKDACYTKVPGTWGTEVVWGEGEVNAPAFLTALKEIGFGGYLAVEREAGNDRAGEIALALSRLREFQP